VIDVQRVDFSSFLTQDIPRAKRFYSEILGLEFDGETLQTSVCRMAFFHDPDGNLLMLHRRFDAE